MPDCHTDRVTQLEERWRDSARGGADSAFEALARRHRLELFAHCYRMLGSVQDAEDAVQEALLAAWRGLGGFQGRSSLRTWLYRVDDQRLPAAGQAPATVLRLRSGAQ